MPPVFQHDLIVHWHWIIGSARIESINSQRLVRDYEHTVDRKAVKIEHNHTQGISAHIFKTSLDYYAQPKFDTLCDWKTKTVVLNIRNN